MNALGAFFDGAARARREGQSRPTPGPSLMSLLVAFVVAALVLAAVLAVVVAVATGAHAATTPAPVAPSTSRSAGGWVFPVGALVVGGLCLLVNARWGRS